MSDRQGLGLTYKGHRGILEGAELFYTSIVAVITQPSPFAKMCRTLRSKG